jgi:hypothetical protein
LKTHQFCAIMAAVGNGRSVEGKEYTLPGPLAVSAISGEYHQLSIPALAVLYVERQSSTFFQCFNKDSTK